MTLWRLSALLGFFLAVATKAKNWNFTCSDGSSSLAMYNDDYCDCDDGSDEPFTTACSNGTFACKSQHNPHVKPSHIPRSHVNDGFCDCPDGSDEQEGICAPNMLDRNLGLSRERTQQLFELHKKGAEIRAETTTVDGKRVKRGLQKQIKKVNQELEVVYTAIQESKAAQDYASYQGNLQEQRRLSSELGWLEHLQKINLKQSFLDWYALSQFCFRAVRSEKVVKGGNPVAGDSPSYVFEVCPLGLASQWKWEENTNTNTNTKNANNNNDAPPEFLAVVSRTDSLVENFQKTYIGRHVGFDEEKETMAWFLGGAVCPNGVYRNMRLELVCGLEPKLGLIAENGMCEYHVKLESPAGCLEEEAERLRQVLDTWDAAAATAQHDVKTEL